MIRSLENDAGKKAGITANEADGTIISDPTALRKLVSPQAAVSKIDKPLKWIAFLMALYYHGVPLYGVRPMVLGPQNHPPTLDIGDESGSLGIGLGFSRLPCQRHHRLYR